MNNIHNDPLISHPLTRLALAMVAALSLAAPIAANAQSATAHAGMASSSASAMDMSGMPMRKSMDSMHEKMSAMPMSGNQDVDFANMMRMHHQGALDMAKIELEKGKDPEMRSTAKKIIAAQKKEIAEFDRWLAAHKSK